jgi:hypothetical protein
MKQKHLLFVLAFLGLTYQNASSQDRQLSISGSVRDTSGRALAGVTIRISRLATPDNALQTTSADSIGHFNFHFYSRETQAFRK